MLSLYIRLTDEKYVYLNLMQRRVKNDHQLQYSAGDAGLDNSGKTPTFVMQQVACKLPVILNADLYRQIKWWKQKAKQ